MYWQSIQRIESEIDTKLPDFTRSVIIVQSLIRRMLAQRKVAEIRIDNMIEDRIRQITTFVDSSNVIQQPAPVFAPHKSKVIQQLEKMMVHKQIGKENRLPRALAQAQYEEHMGNLREVSLFSVIPTSNWLNVLHPTVVSKTVARQY